MVKKSSRWSSWTKTIGDLTTSKEEKNKRERKKIYSNDFLHQFTFKPMQKIDNIFIVEQLKSLFYLDSKAHPYRKFYIFFK